MNKLICICFLLLGCSLKKKEPTLDCTGIDLKTVDVLVKEMITIDIPIAWNKIDTVPFNPDKYFISTKTIYSPDSSSYFFSKAHTLPSGEIQRTDSIGLISQLDADLKSISRGLDSLMSSVYVQFHDWRIAVRKSYIRNSKYKLVGQMLCARGDLRIEIYLRLMDSSFQKGDSAISCILNTLKISNSEILNNYSFPDESPPAATSSIGKDVEGLIVM
jgi:hypothetical protein